MQLTNQQRRRFYPVLTAREEADFWQQIDQDDGCWPWRTWLPIIEPRPTYYLRWRRVNAARLAYWCWYGIQPGLSNVLHSCRNPACCNPMHLYLRKIDDKGQ